MLPQPFLEPIIDVGSARLIALDSAPAFKASIGLILAPVLLGCPTEASLRAWLGQAPYPRLRLERFLPYGSKP